MSHEDNHQTEEREFVQSRREKAEQGDLSAQFALAYFYHSRDNAEALRWFERAAGQGHAEARFWAGKMYADGDGVQKNSEEALRWLRLAAEQGHGSAQARLATMYVEGDGVQKNGEEALRWLRLAAEARVIDALMDLGKMHLKGEGVPQDHAEAERLLSLAAELDPEVQAEVVGDMYAEGRDVRQDGEKAAKFYSWNINENLETSQPVKVKLGLLYLDGLGVPKDEAEARRWFEEAFEYSELPEAAHQIGMLYESGRAVNQSDVHAYTWYLVAEVIASEPADSKQEMLKAPTAREKLEKRMSDDQIAEAKQIIREWDEARDKYEVGQMERNSALPWPSDKTNAIGKPKGFYKFPPCRGGTMYDGEDFLER